MARQKVVIVGGGFGGLHCAKRLSGGPVDVLLVDKNNYHLFTPLLYQVASSLLNPSDIAYPIRQVFRKSKNVRFRMAEVTGVDFERKTIQVADGNDIDYDRLVLAPGSETNHFRIAGIQEHSRGLKDLPEALELRGQILECFETASREPRPELRRPWLTFVVVGGGPTGVEYAGALAELVRLVLAKDHPEFATSEVRIVLVEAAGRVLPPFPEPLSEEARKTLDRLGVELRLGKQVEKSTEDSVELAGGETIEARTVVWAAGVRPGSLVQKLDLPRTPSGRIQVDPQLRVLDREGVYAIGDAAAVMQEGRELPMMAPQAMQEARHVADNILREQQSEPLLPFRYRDLGTMATIGRNSAVAVIGAIKIKGFLGWAAWLILHLAQLIGFRNRLAVLANWAWSYFFYDRPVRLIYEKAKDRS